MRVVVSGYAVGFRKKEKQKTDGYYYQLDLLQFGDSEKPSEIKSILVYENKLARFIDENFIDGKIKIVTCKVDLIFNKNDYIWLLRSIETFNSVSSIDNITVSLDVLSKLKQYILNNNLDYTINTLVENIILEYLENTNECN